MKAELKKVARLHIREENTHQNLKTAINVVGILVGGYAVRAFWPSVKKLVQNYQPGYRIFLISSTLGINVVVNCYYNTFMAKELFALRDLSAKTFKLTIPVSHLVSLLGFGVASSLPFAFLDAENAGDFIPLSFVYSMQHSFALKDTYDYCKEKIAKPCEIKSGLSEKLGNALSVLNKTPDDVPVSHFFTQDGEIDQDRLLDWIDGLPLEVRQESACMQSMACFFLYGGIQFVGVLATFVSNVGYHSNTLLSLDLGNPILTQVVSAVCMVPVYWLGLIATYKTIAKFSTCGSGMEVSLPVRKAPVFATVLTASLGTMAVFSFCSAVSLLEDALYGDNPQFSWLDTDKETLRPAYYYIVAAITDIFNSVPIEDVVGGAAKYFCKWFGSPLLKQQIKVFEFIQGMSYRVAKATPQTFENETDLEQPLLEEHETASRCSPCTRITTAVRSWFSWFTTSSPQGSVQQAQPHVLINAVS